MRKDVMKVVHQLLCNGFVYSVGIELRIAWFINPSKLIGLCVSVICRNLSSWDNDGLSSASHLLCFGVSFPLWDERTAFNPLHNLLLFPITLSFSSHHSTHNSGLLTTILALSLMTASSVRGSVITILSSVFFFHLFSPIHRIVGKQ